jgi:hypothetical protein
MRSHAHVSPISPVSWSQVHEEKVAASATCQNAACDRIALKIVNFSSYKQRIAGQYGGCHPASGVGWLRAWGLSKWACGWM